MTGQRITLPHCSSFDCTVPSKSELRPPKLAPSTWQLYFTDWIQRHQAQGDKKLNVAQAAKEAGSEYANLTPEQKEPYKRRSLAAKEARERELAAWQRTLTPDDIKRENAFRTAQRKAGKSRRGNIKDPNAPKKPLSAYFMFLHHIRSHPELVREVFGDERETTSQSVLAAAKWRSMTDEERKPFLARAEQEKLDYEAARRLYEEGTPGFETTISFNLPSPSPFLSSSPTGPTFMFPPPPSPSSPQGAKQQHYQYQYQPQQFGQVHIEQQQQQIQQHQQGLMPPPAQSHSPHLREFSSESEVDSEGFVTDEGDDHRRRPPAVRRS
ncbi:hypothetical protein BD410DRAFT_43554 [Rickenella mellea]|uniref:HMG box domain-containing protein n=1 Tax=Rickenella mellea TaxID=50990 RepID=A0A4R5XHC4_9AGAM|nr:hypothetical protein BD410DRAFT_43554 [Rickenella mellea]